jgi:hypothetical protein
MKQLPLTKQIHIALRSLQICLDEIWTRVNVDLAKDALARVNESVRRIRGNYGNAAGLNFTFFIADRDPGRTFDDKRNLDVRMLMQRGTLPGLGGNDVTGKRRTLSFADELMRHSNKGQLLEI